MSLGDEATDGPDATGTPKAEPEAASDDETVTATTDQDVRHGRGSTKRPPATRGHVSDHVARPSGGAGDV
jgi:hypothetical protein